MTNAEKNQMSKEERAKKEQQEASMRSTFTPYKGKTSGLKTLTPNKRLLDSGWNESHLFSVTAADPVYVHPDQKGIDKNYVRVIYHAEKFVAILAKDHFKN